MQFQVTDGNGDPVIGTLKVEVEPPGSLNPVGTPDFATGFTGDTIVIEPLLNDLSPSGVEPVLVAMDEPGDGAVASFNTDRGTVTFSSVQPRRLLHEVHAAEPAPPRASASSASTCREPVDGAEVPPVAVKDVAYLRSDEPVTVSVLGNDISPTGQGAGGPVRSMWPPSSPAKGLVVELLEATLIRITAPAALTEQVGFTYTVSDGDQRPPQPA